MGADPHEEDRRRLRFGLIACNTRTKRIQEVHLSDLAVRHEEVSDLDAGTRAAPSAGVAARARDLVEVTQEEAPAIFLVILLAVCL